MASAKSEALHDEGAAWRPSTGQKIKNFIRKTWWIGLIIAIVLVVILVPVLLLVVYPHIAQSAVNKATIVVLSQKALNPTPDNIKLDINNTFLIKSKYHPILYPFNSSLYIDEDAPLPFVSFESPKINHVKNGSIAFVNQTVPLVNLDAFTEFTKKALMSKNFTVVLKGRGKLKEGGLPKTSVTYNQKAVVTGLDGLNSVNITEVTLLKTALSDGSNAVATVVIDNPSIFTLDLGNVSLSLAGPAPNHTALGTTILQNALVQPGSNTLGATVKADVLSIASLITQDKKYGCGIFPITITGNNVTYNDADLAYYTAAIQQLNVTTSLDLRKTLQDAGYGIFALDTHDS